MLYIFNQNEQLQAILKPDTNPTYARPAGETYYIQMQHPVPDETLAAPATACPYYDAYHTEKLNGENVFIFTVPANHPDSQYVVEGNMVAFKDLDANWQLFEIKRITDIHGDGLTRTAFCEHIFYELLDDIIVDKRPVGSAINALTSALENTRWQVGIVDDLGSNSTNFYYESALSAVQKVANTWKGELRWRIVIAGGIIERYVDLLAMRGTDTGKQFAYAKDIKSIEREVDLSGVCTALYGRGKGVETESGEGYGRRLTFAEVVWSTATGNPVDKPAGQEWIGDPDALARWGRPGGRHRFGVFTDEDETDPTILLQKTWDELQKRKVPRVTYRLDVLSLEKLTGYEHEQIRLGDLVRVIDREFRPELIISARVIELERDLLAPENTKVVLGSFAPSIVEAQINVEKRIEDIANKPYNTKWLDGKISVLQNEIENTSAYVFITPDDGILILDAPTYEQSTKAMKLGGGIFAIANQKDGQGGWNWRTFGDGAGFTADEINAGKIRADLVQIGAATEYEAGYNPSIKVKTFYQSTTPTATTVGDLWFNTSSQEWHRWDGSAWIKADGAQDKIDSHNLLESPHNLPSYTKLTSDGIKVYDGSDNLRCHLGQYNTGKYGLKVTNGEIYSTLFKTGTETATDYIALAPGDEPLRVVKGNKDALTIWTYGNSGSIQIYDTVANNMRGMITVADDILGDGLRLIGRDTAGYNKDVIVEGAFIRLYAPNVFIGNGATPGTTVWGDLYVTGDLSAGGSKPARQVTQNYGERYLYARESPDVRYIIEGKAQLVNGECRIDLDPIFLECVEPDSDTTPWLIHLTPMADIHIYVAEIGATYIVVKESTTTSNDAFFWSLSAIRKGYAGVWLEQPKSDEDVLTSNWEDELGVVIDEEPESNMG